MKYIVFFYVGLASLSLFLAAVAQQERETSELREQLQTIVGDLGHIKSKLSTIDSSVKKGRKAIPREVSVSV